MTFESSAGGVALTDEVWVAGHDPRADRIIATGGWAVCLEGVGWRAPAGVSLHAGSGVTLAVLMKDAPAKHILRLDRAANTYTIHQIPVNKMEFVPGEWPAALVPLTIEASGLTSGPLLCADDQKYALEGVEAVLPFTCRTKAPHTAQPTLDIASGQLGCQVIPAAPHTEASEVELCAEWEVYRTCTKVLLLPPIQVSHRTLSLVEPNPIFTITGHPLALKGVKTSVSPGLKIEKHVKDGEINVLVKSETTVCGLGWVNVKSKLTAQSVRVEIDRKCDVTCGTLLGAIFSLVKPYLSMLATIAAIAAGILFVQAKTQQLRSNSTLRNDPSQSVLPAEATPPPPLRSRTWARSPYAAGPVTPVYGDASALPDNSFSPNSTRMHSRFL
ncbi:hypothetical protein O0L34_g343 [Tuta absoluta]|nr:hypothetical protein O0L34_g343 [Tuta absoluta]